MWERSSDPDFIETNPDLIGIPQSKSMKLSDKRPIMERG
jgi:hypothetical protein